MRWFFFKTYLQVIFLSVAVFIVSLFLFAPLFLGEELEQFEMHTDAEYRLLVSELNSVPEAEWESHVRQYRNVFELQLEVVSQDDLETHEVDALRGAGIQKYYSTEDDERWNVLYSLPPSDKIIRIWEGVEIADEQWDALDEESRERFSIRHSLLDWLQIFIPLFILSLAYAISAILILRSVSAPLKELSEVAAKFGAGNLRVRANDPKPPVDQLGQNFNTMADRIEEQILEQQILIGAIPHELRTPVSRIRTALDMSRSRKTLEALRSQIEQIDGYADELEQSVEDVLELARLKSGKASLNETFDLAVVIQEVMSLEKDERLRIRVDCADSLPVVANQGLIRRALINLVTNAGRHAHYEIRLAARLIGSDIHIKIEDDGTGVPEDKLSEIFLPFSRLDESRSRVTGSLGLGLAFVRAIIVKHGGVVRARNLDVGGLSVELSWPQNQSDH